jgi:hypothetical protein
MQPASTLKFKCTSKDCRRRQELIRWLVHPHHADDLRRHISPERLAECHLTDPSEGGSKRPIASDLPPRRPTFEPCQSTVQHGQR